MRNPCRDHTDIKCGKANGKSDDAFPCKDDPPQPKFVTMRVQGVMFRRMGRNPAVGLFFPDCRHTDLFSHRGVLLTHQSITIQMGC